MAHSTTFKHALYLIPRVVGLNAAAAASGSRVLILLKDQWISRWPDPDNAAGWYVASRGDVVMHSNGRDTDIIVLIAVARRHPGYVFYASNASYLIILVI